MDKYDKKAAALIDRTYQTPEIIHQRLRTLAALGLRQGESVFDAGCGTGLLLEQQALAVGPTGRAEGIDASADMLAHAEARCGNLAQVKLHQGSVDALPLDDACFDALSCTQVLLYVDRIEQALGEYHRVLKAGGRLAIIETDWGGAILNSHDIAMTQAIFNAWSDEVPNPHLPRRITPLLRAAGFGAIRIEAIPVVNASYSEHSFSAGMMENYTRTARKLGAIDEQQAEAWLAGLRQLAAQDDYFFCVNRFLITATR